MDHDYKVLTHLDHNWKHIVNKFLKSLVGNGCLCCVGSHTDRIDIFQHIDSMSVTCTKPNFKVLYTFFQECCLCPCHVLV